MRAAQTTTETTNWRAGLPVLTASTLRLRELRTEDAKSLSAMLTTDEVSRFLSPPPSTVEGFERFITWTRRQRVAGTYACFAVVPADRDIAVGIFQVHTLDGGSGTAEWGFALGSAFWGNGMFLDGARLVADFAFDVMGIRRLEARTAVANGRGNSALRKLGAVQEGVLRRSFRRHGRDHDQALWGLLDEDWQLRRLSGVETTVTH